MAERITMSLYNAQQAHQAIQTAWKHAKGWLMAGDHYASKQVQPWDAMQSWMTPAQFEGFLRGNVIKYIARYPDKNGIEDVKKAQHYLAKLLEHLEAA